MVAIPRSQGVQARPIQTTPSVAQPVNTGENFIAQGMKDIGGAITSLATISMLRNQEEQKNYEISVINDFDTQLQRFDNQERVKLNELGATPEVIGRAKKDILERRKVFAQKLKQSFQDNKRLLSIANEKEKDVFRLEYFIDQDLSNKKRQYGQNNLYQSISELQREYEGASPEDLEFIEEKANDLLQDGINRNLIDGRDSANIIEKFRSGREKNLKLQKDLLDKAQKLRIQNPWEFIDQFEEAEPPSLDTNNVDNIAKSLQERIDYVDNKNQQYQIDLPVLSPLETEGFINNIEKANPNEAAIYLRDFANNITDEQKDILSQHIFKQNKTLGIALTLADEDSKLASDIISGNKTLKNKTIVVPSENELKETFLSKYGKAITQEEFRNAAIEGVRALYANKALITNATSYQSNITQEVAERLFGKVITINDSDIVGFRKNNGQFIDEDEFEDLFDGLNYNRIKSFHNDFPRITTGEELDIEDIKEAGLVVVGDGLYTINLYNEFAVDKDGNPFILNLKGMYNK